MTQSWNDINYRKQVRTKRDAEVYEDYKQKCREWWGCEPADPEVYREKSK